MVTMGVEVLTMLDPLKLCVKKRNTSSAMGSTLICRYCR